MVKNVLKEQTNILKSLENVYLFIYLFVLYPLYIYVHFIKANGIIRYLQCLAKAFI